MILAAFLSLLASDFEVSGATVSAFPIAVAEVSAAGPEGLAAASLRKRIEKMLALSGMFRVLDRKGFLAPATETEDMQAIQWAAWQQVGAREGDHHASTQRPGPRGGQGGGAESHSLRPQRGGGR